MPSKAPKTPEKLLNQARFLIAAVEPAQWPSEEGVEVAFAGRSNVGKSSAINTIAGRRGLARTSKTPGRTRQIVFFELGGGSRLVDLPGYGYAEVPERLRVSWAGLIEKYLTDRKALAGLVLLMDARRPLTDLDRRMLKWCESCSLPVHILLAKTDKVSHSQAARAELAVTRFAADLANPATVQQFSALRRIGVDQAREKVRQWLAGPSGRKKRAPEL